MQASFRAALRQFVSLWIAISLASALGCSHSDEAKDHVTKKPAGNANSVGESPMTITITSRAFEAGQPIPKKFTGDGEDVSPQLSWTGVPQGTKQLALICDDPDAPRADPWVHWVIYHLPADLTSLPEGVAPSRRLDQPAGALQGVNSWSSGRTIGYRGPAPPPGKPHRYFFKLYALEAELKLEPGLEVETLLRAIQGHTLAEGQLVGTYQR
jgi:Raf kinase inhibitor-like YbhB/YbcL family protein